MMNDEIIRHNGRRAVEAIHPHKGILVIAWEVSSTAKNRTKLNLRGLMGYKLRVFLLPG